jgi:hypothetical protein
VRGKKHPGYSWLAYDWQNLLPACNQCNTAGKMNHFPIAGKYTTRPSRGKTTPTELDATEKPLLLHPYIHDPQKHLRFGENGVVAAIDDNLQGKVSIEIYKLKRGALVAARQEKQELAWLKVKNALDTDPSSAEAVLKSYLLGKESYSAAVRDYVKLKILETRERLSNLERIAGQENRSTAPKARRPSLSTGTNTATSSVVLGTALPSRSRR